MADGKGGELRGRRLLVVEDDYMIATDLAYMLEERGVEVIGPAGTVADALGLLEAGEAFDGAVLDINLGEEMVYPVADELKHRGLPFVFATGYSALVVPTAHADVPRVEKPVDVATLSRLLARRIEAFAERSSRSLVMNLTEDESQTLRAMRAVTTNPQGEDVFVGLDRSESAEFLELSRRNESGDDMSASPRFVTLREKHEAARQTVVSGQASLDQPPIV